MRLTRTLSFAVVALALATPRLEAQEASRFGIGFQSSWPAYGISGIYDVNDKVTAQVVLGAFGALTTISARGLYHFQKEQKHSLYGYGTAGLWRHSFRGFGVSETESSPGLGARAASSSTGARSSTTATSRPSRGSIARSTSVLSRRASITTTSRAS